MIMRPFALVAATLVACLSCGMARAELDPDRLAEAIATLQIAERDCLQVFPPKFEEELTLRALNAMGGVKRDTITKLTVAVYGKAAYARSTWSTEPGSAYCRHNVADLMKAWRLYILYGD
jgi:hypothetical protein